MYWLEQHARGPDGVRRRRAGLIAALRLEPYAPGRVRRHERTLEGPKAGRLAVLRAVRANLSPIFMAYGDPSRQHQRDVRAARRRARAAARDDRRGGHVAPALARLRGGAAAARASTSIGSRPLTIIDGHHRYETALAYRDERRAADGDPDELQAYDFAPVYLANRHDPGLMLFPTHRVVSGLRPELWERLPELLAERWELEEVADVDALERRVVAPSRGVRSFGLVRGNGAPPLHARLRGEAPSALDVVAVETLVLDDLLGLDADAIATTDRIAYRRRADDAAALVDAAAAAHRRRAARAGAHRRGRRSRRRGRPDDAAEVDVLLPEDPRRHGLQPARSVRTVTAEHWLEVCRAMRDAVVAAVAEVPRARRADELGRGAGGDLTVAIDQAAEDAALGVLAAVAEAGEGFTVVSEEVGERSFGGGGHWRVVIDPIDGSLNAKRGLPLYALSVAVADGPAMADVALGYVYDLGNGEEWIARRGGGATVNGVPLGSSRPLGPPAARRPRGDAARASRAGRRRAARRGRARARAGLAGARALPSRRRPGRCGREPAPQRRALDRHRRGAARGARGRQRRRAAGFAGRRSGTRRSISWAARASSPHATTHPSPGSPRCSASAPRRVAFRIRASMPS